MMGIIIAETDALTAFMYGLGFALCIIFCVNYLMAKLNFLFCFGIK